MDLYSRFLIYFLYAFHNVYDRLETFVFSTSLFQITDILANNEFDKAMEILAERVPNWSGSTQIGNSFHTFVKDFGYRLLDKKTVVLIVSDGWDTGNIDVLSESMRQIYKWSSKVIWLNPLAGNPNFSPDVAGMKAALPYIDVFLPAHNVDSLRTVIPQLKGKRRRKIRFDS